VDPTVAGGLTIRCSPYRMLRDGPHFQCASREDQRDFIAQSYDGDGWGARDGAIPRPLSSRALDGPCVGVQRRDTRG
jgi:hypothetical protein